MTAVQRPIAVQLIQERPPGARMENDSLVVSSRKKIA